MTSLPRPKSKEHTKLTNTACSLPRYIVSSVYLDKSKKFDKFKYFLAKLFRTIPISFVLTFLYISNLWHCVRSRFSVDVILANWQHATFLEIAKKMQLLHGLISASCRRQCSDDIPASKVSKRHNLQEKVKLQLEDARIYSIDIFRYVYI